MSVIPSRCSPRLADHVRACRVGDRIILLDLLRGKYIGLGGTQLSSLSTAIFGDPSIDDADATDECLSNGEVWIQRLLNQQLLSFAPRASQSTPAVLIEPATSLGTGETIDAFAFEWGDLLSLWRATLITRLWLRQRSLADIADRVAALRAPCSNRDDENASQAMLAAAMSYVHLRPFALTAYDRCLNDSLALIHFLATKALFPQWVIGVRVHPFGAHSWVQSGGVVLNDLPERVRHYQPILVV